MTPLSGSPYPLKELFPFADYPKMKGQYALHFMIVHGQASANIAWIKKQPLRPFLIYFHNVQQKMNKHQLGAPFNAFILHLLSQHKIKSLIHLLTILKKIPLDEKTWQQQLDKWNVTAHSLDLLVESLDHFFQKPISSTNIQRVVTSFNQLPEEYRPIMREQILEDFEVKPEHQAAIAQALEKEETFSQCSLST
jgi:hypothetical protein